MPPAHLATPQVIEDEIRELHEYDFVFASNPEVEASLERIGIPHDRILPVTFGWTSDKFAGRSPIPAGTGSAGAVRRHHRRAQRGA
jgi:hypothetical protein